MNKEALIQRLTDIEWDDFEVKKASHELPKNVWETVSAFSNAAGGWIVFGVSQQGKRYEVVGVEHPEKIEQDFTTTLRNKQKFNLVIMPECRKYIIDGMTVLAFYIPSADKKPVYFNALQNTFIRTASGDQRATEHEINALYRDQSFGSMSAKTVDGTTPDSLNPSSYKNFRGYLKRMMPELSYNALDDETFNRKLQIVKDGKLTYGGLLMLGRNEEIQDSFPDFRVDYLEIPGLSYADAEPRYTYRIQEQENLWEYYFVLFQRIRIYADNPLYIGDMGIGHEDTKQQDALREALVNLLMHSDFFSPMKPRIRVFTNRIEFENPGALPRPVKELLNEDVTIPRNPVIAKLFRVANLCENAGYGFDKMLAWKTETQQEVTFDTWVDKTKVTFMLKDGKVVMPEIAEKPQENNLKTTRKQPENNQKQPENHKKTTRKPQENNQKTTRKQPENHKKTTEKPQENDKETTRKFEEIRATIIVLLEKDSAISTPDIAKQLNISYASVRHHIEKLKEDGRISREGADKGGIWVVIKK